MKTLLAYYRKHRFIILAYLLGLAIFLLALVLYRPDIEVILYPLGLSLLVFVVFGLVDINKQKAHQAKIREFVENDNRISVDDEEEKYLLETIADLKKKLKQLNTLRISEQTEMMDFYMMWVHQIKIPISALRLLLEDKDDIHLEVELLKIEQYVNMVLNAIRLNDTANDLLIESVDLNHLIKAAIKTYSTIFIQKHLSVSYIESDALVLSDRKWLSFVVEQLLSNALKYTKKGGVTITYTDGILNISDTGIGIAEDDLPRVFEKGYTGKVGRSEMQATGLGLFLSKKILDHLGHDIQISSKINVGTSVSINLNSTRRVLD